MPMFCCQQHDWPWIVVYSFGRTDGSNMVRKGHGLTFCNQGNCFFMTVHIELSFSSASQGHFLDQISVKFSWIKVKIVYVSYKCWIQCINFMVGGWVILHKICGFYTQCIHSVYMILHKTFDLFTLFWRKFSFVKNHMFRV